MAISSFPNPFAFTPLPVTVFCTIIYLALSIVVLSIHLRVPPAPTATPSNWSVNLTEAWLDLQHLSNGFHPYNSRRNDVIHDWILRRLDAIVEGNGHEGPDNPASGDSTGSSWGCCSSIAISGETEPSSSAEVTVFNDMTSNLTFSAGSSNGGISTYFEGTNIVVYVRGTEDEKGEWWTDHRFEGPKGVLINAHYDSVATGNGATDDGVGVISTLQVIKHFSSRGNQPKHGFLALFNNGEENFLNGARAFALHPTSRFPTAFLNLEGAGAGGRATLFRSTDTEVTKKYKGTEHPFGNVISRDAFEAGFIRSQTDYVVFNGEMNMRGLDISFYEPRSMYHTGLDDARHTSKDSLWHMLSAALHTMHGLTEDEFVKQEGSDAVWFDIFGKAFAILELHSMFAISVTLLVVSPVVLIAAFTILSQTDRLYAFSNAHGSSGQKIRLRGMRGFSRFPFLVVIPTVILVGLALLVVKVNPFIVYSSPYAVWAMMLSAWLFVSWFISRTADFARPSALHRLYTCLWLFVTYWGLLVVVTVLEDNMRIASGFYVVWYFLAVSLATIVAIFELFALEGKDQFAQKQLDGPSEILQGDAPTSTRARQDQADRPQSSAVASSDEEPTETTSLLSGNQRSSFANYSYNIAENDSGDQTSKLPRPYEYEQDWSVNLPSWTWILQALLLLPINIILLGQIGLEFTAAMYQTLSDGSPALPVYLLFVIVSTLFFIPLVPFLHRFTYHIPTFCLFVFIGTVVYTCVAFPFSDANALKFYFVQRVDLESGLNKVGLSGIDSPILEDVVRSLPSSAGQSFEKVDSVRADLVEYSWYGLPPQVVRNTHPDVPPEMGFSDWLSFNVSRIASNKARFTVRGRNTRSCKIQFHQPVLDVEVDGSAYDERFPTRVLTGIKEIRLWSREWEKPWTVTAMWAQQSEEGLDGHVVCLWNEEQNGLIPALEEVRRFAPPWSRVTNLGDGLVEGYKAFMV